MRACKFGCIRRLFWNWVPRDHKNGSIGKNWTIFVAPRHPVQKQSKNTAKFTCTHLFRFLIHAYRWLVLACCGWTFLLINTTLPPVYKRWCSETGCDPGHDIKSSDHESLCLYPFYLIGSSTANIPKRNLYLSCHYMYNMCYGLTAGMEMYHSTIKWMSNTISYSIIKEVFLFLHKYILAFQLVMSKLVKLIYIKVKSATQKWQKLFFYQKW